MTKDEEFVVKIWEKEHKKLLTRLLDPNQASYFQIHIFKGGAKLTAPEPSVKPTSEIIRFYRDKRLTDDVIDIGVELPNNIKKRVASYHFDDIAQLRKALNYDYPSAPPEHNPWYNKDYSQTFVEDVKEVFAIDRGYLFDGILSWGNAAIMHGQVMGEFRHFELRRKFNFSDPDFPTYFIIARQPMITPPIELERGVM